MQNITAERDQYQNLLNDINREVPNLRNQIQDLKNQHTNTYWSLRENWELAQNRQAEIVNTQRERDEHKRNAHRMTVRYNTNTEHWRRRHASCIRQAQNWKAQCRNTQNQMQARDQNILNLQQQIFVLQNNPPQVRYSI